MARREFRTAAVDARAFATAHVPDERRHTLRVYNAEDGRNQRTRAENDGPSPFPQFSKDGPKSCALSACRAGRPAYSIYIHLNWYSAGAQEANSG